MTPRVPGLVLALLVAASTLAAQAPAVPVMGESYASISRLPDWSGAWIWPWPAFEAENIRLRDPTNPDRPRLRPEYDATRTAAFQRAATGGASAAAAGVAPLCQAGRFPYVMGFSFAIELLPSPGRMTMLLEQGSVIRRIHTDGRTHDPDAEATWTGESIGRWDGDTLVVVTTNIKPRPQQRGALMTTERATITERIRLRDTDHLEIAMVVDDPVTLEAPWRTTRTYERVPPVFFDRACDNNRDGNDEEPDLNPPTP